MSGDVRRVSFGPYVLDGEARELLRAGVAVHLSRKAMDTLLLLVAKRSQVLKKQDLFDRIWPNCYVSEATLASVIAEIRRALREPARQPRYVRTVHGVGYRFVEDVHEIEKVSAPAPARCSIVYDQHEHLLTDGEHVVGRSEPAKIVLMSRSVSRRHARIVVTQGSATLEDLGSKNGTFLNARRIGSPERLADGDQIGIARFVLHFRALEGTTATGLTMMRTRRPGHRE
jgi:DNA-binding winged helix-turn-helix (wHTH) protein